MGVEFLILDSIQAYMSAPWLDEIMVFFSNIGNAGLIWIFLAGLMVISKRYRKGGIIAFIALGIGLLVANVALKPLVARIRPCDINTAVDLLIARPTDFSFPSGHTVSSFAAAVSILFVSKRWGLDALILASVIAFSRLYLYVHFPSDIIAGIAIGIISAFVAREIYNWVIGSRFDFDEVAHQKERDEIMEAYRERRKVGDQKDLKKLKERQEQRNKKKK